MKLCSFIEQSSSGMSTIPQRVVWQRVLVAAKKEHTDWPISILKTEISQVVVGTRTYSHSGLMWNIFATPGLAAHTPLACIASKKQKQKTTTTWNSGDVYSHNKANFNCYMILTWISYLTSPVALDVIAVLILILFLFDTKFSTCPQGMVGWLL